MEITYTINEWASSGRFDYSPELIKAALKAAGKKEYTQKEATAVINKFAKTEVR